MFKKLTVLAVAVAALAALAIPASASANWQHNGGLLLENKTIEIETQLSLQSEVGSIKCGMWIHADLLAQQTTATVTNVAVNLLKGGTVTDTCSVGGGLTGLGCIDVGSLTVDIGPDDHWTAHGNGTRNIAITTDTMQAHLHGGMLCPKTIQITPSTINFVPEKEAFGTGELQGTVQTHLSAPMAGEKPAIVTGHGNVIPAGTYGVK